MISPTPVALVTGAGIRIGRAIALALAGAGFDLILHANRSREPLLEVKARIEALGRRAYLQTADLGSAEAVDALAARLRSAHPRIDALIHNAGTFEEVPFAAVSRDAFRQMQAVNLEAPFFLTQGLLPCLEAAPDPVIIHITDIYGERPVGDHSHYVVSKAGLVVLTRALAVELAPRIRVNGVSPGAVAFPEHYDAEARAEVLERVPLAREGRVEDIARAVLFLVKDAPYVTGQILAVDGGRSSTL